MNSIAAAECLEEVAQNFPIVARVSGAADGAVEALQTAFAIDHRAALFRERE